jgi:hypothetical protein
MNKVTYDMLIKFLKGAEKSNSLEEKTIEYIYAKINEISHHKDIIKTNSPVARLEEILKSDPSISEEDTKTIIDNVIRIEIVEEL